ncbi:MAG: hypothetical protein MHMPM18_004073, partial [Marteilia pararefringens]
HFEYISRENCAEKADSNSFYQIVQYDGDPNDEVCVCLDGYMMDRNYNCIAKDQCDHPKSKTHDVGGDYCDQ